MHSFTRGTYSLQSDLDALSRLAHAQTPEAVAFYAGRILEVLAAQSLEDLGLEPHATVLANLDILEQYALLPTPTRYSAHGIRRLANDARHVLRPIQPADAALATRFVDLWLHWYFHHYNFGPRHPDPQDAATLALVNLLDNCHTLSAKQALDQLHAAVGTHQSPALIAILIESFLNAGRNDAAQELLTPAVAAFPADLRLTLLQGLLHSRTGKLPEALALLEPLAKRFANDPEAVGILAGAYKRLWQQALEAGNNAPSPESARWLKRAHDTYYAGWKNSRQSSDYLGTNAATTALFLGKPDLAASIAATIRDLITHRMARLAPRMPDPLAALDYWSAATLAELQLLSGDLPAAQATYARLFALHAAKTGCMDVSRRQAALILHAQGLPSAALGL